MYLKTIFQLAKYLFLFSVMGASYMMLEILWRGYSHFSMFLLAGTCGVLIGTLDTLLPPETSIWLQMSIGTGIILTGEFITGCVLNLWLGLDIWDYSDIPFNILGQICLPFAAAWFFLSMIVIILDDYLRCWFFGERKPHYYWGLHMPFRPAALSTPEEIPYSTKDASTGAFFYMLRQKKG
ncbi:MAG: hypothetical protein IJW67_02445 [Blautia sp.]|nr:hypothetical protein [Blautia sp.]